MFIQEENGLYYNSIFLVCDIVAMELALFFAFMLRKHMAPIVFLDNYILFGISVIFITLFVAFFSENYKGLYERGYYLELVKVVKFITIIFFLEILRIFVLRTSGSFSRFIMLVWYVASIPLVYLVRIYLKKSKLTFIKRRMKKVLLVVTDKSHLEMALGYIDYKIPKDYFIAKVGLIDDYFPTLKHENFYLYGEDSILKYALTEVVDEVLITHVNDINKAEKMAEGIVSMGITVHFDVYRMDNNLSCLLSSRIGELSVLTTCSNCVSEKNLFLKRMLDIVGAFIGLTLSIPVFLVVAPLIYISSPGSVFFKQKRVGKNGRIFTLYKFRSMYMDAEERKKELMQHNEMNGLMFKMENDPRITPIGKFIRKTSLDELPQFWNVLIGDMSLVGTRPPTVDEYEHYEWHHKARLAMKPGITGMWQVSGRSDITDFEEVVALDREYIDNWNIGKDIKLLLKTVKVVFISQGAR